MMARAMFMKSPRLAFVLLTLAVLGVPGVFGPSPASAQARVELVYPRNMPFVTQYERGLRTELEALMGAGAVELRRPEDADGTIETYRRNLDAAYANPDVRVVVAIGPQSGNEILRRGRLSKPTILPFVVPELQQLPRAGATSGHPNLAYITGFIDLERDLRQLRQVVRYRKVAILAARRVLDALPGLEAYATEAASRLGVEATLVPTEVSEGTVAEVEAIFARIPDDVDAVYLGALGSLTAEGAQALIDGLNARRLPTFTVNGVGWVERGVLATATPDSDQLRRLRRVAIYVQRAIEGEDPATFQVTFAAQTDLVINMRTARQIGAWPRFEVLTEARLLNNEGGRRVGESLTIEDVVRGALASNYDLLAADRTMVAGRQDVRRARGALLPSLAASSAFTWVDPDVAGVGQTERTLTLGIQGQQVIYSPLAWMGFRASQHQQRSREEEYQTARLDTVLSAAEAYLNVLRAQTAERINRENLQRARANLAAAEARVRIGSAGREEVFRWEIEIAGSRAAVVQASATRNQAEIELNRLMSRELEAPFDLDEVTNPFEALMIDERINELVDNPWAFRHFRTFMVEEAAAQSPEIRQLGALHRAQARIAQGQRRNFIPTLVLTGGVNATLARGGVGAEPPMVGGFTFPQDDFTWQFGLNLQFNIFDGMQRYAEIQQAELGMAQIAFQQQSIAQRIEQRMRSTLHQLGADFANMNLTRDAAEAARQNFALVTDAYQQGTIDIIRLIDAQNQALLTELSAANAVYDFMLSYLRMERASGSFGFDATQQDMDDFYRRASEYMNRARQQEAASAANSDQENP